MTSPTPGMLVRISKRRRKRVIDIDILFYGSDEIADERLVLPHKELFRRAFVLEPLAEIAPDRVIGGRRVIDAARALGGEGIARWEE